MWLRSAGITLQIARQVCDQLLAQRRWKLRHHHLFVRILLIRLKLLCLFDIYLSHLDLWCDVWMALSDDFLLINNLNVRWRKQKLLLLLQGREDIGV